VTPFPALAAWAVGSAALLAGCATAPQAPGSGIVSGRISVRVDATADHPAQSMVSAFELRGNGRSGDLRLISPLGTQLASARWSPGSAVLARPDGEARFSSLDSLSQSAFGEALPLAALPDWLAGGPWPDAPFTAQRPDSSAAAIGFTQLGWSVVTARLAEGWIEATRAAPPRVQLRVKLDLAPQQGPSMP
jgi:outer membrane lipoprotein LolB